MKYAYIVKTPGTCGGRPRIEGTRIAVDMIAEWIVHLRQSPEEVKHSHPHLTLAQIHSALAYYYDHSEEIEESLRRGAEIEKEVRKLFPPSRFAKLQAGKRNKS
jgi:uncharacterized protein (DUF433 family)